MSDLLRPLLIEDHDGAPFPQDMQPEAESIAVRLNCEWCNTVHEFPLADVERIVYALAAAEAQARNADRVVAESPSDFSGTCLNEVLRSANDPELYAETVQDHIESRQRHG